MKIVISGTYKRDELTNWLQKNVGPCIDTDVLLTIGTGWRLESRIIKYFAKEHDVYIDDPQIATLFRLKFG